MSLNDPQFVKDLAALLNCYSVDNETNVPDILLAEHMQAQLSASVQTNAAVARWRNGSTFVVGGSETGGVR